MDDSSWTPLTTENCRLVRGPFYHGTQARLSIGELLVPGFRSNYDEDRVLAHIYFSALLEPAIWGAELSSVFAGSSAGGTVYVVEPVGAFEDDPNLTNKRFPGNPTKSYRSREPLRIVGVVSEWQGHPSEEIQRMVQGLQDLKRRGLHVIED